MLNSKPIDKVLFLDIETTSQYESYKACPEPVKTLFSSRYKKELEEIGKVYKDVEDVYNNKAPLSAEFGKIICISLGIITDKATYKFVTASYSDTDEKKLLETFIAKTKAINTCTDVAKAEYHICAHNGKIFDFPFIAKRLLINGIQLPAMFDFSELKPWDLKYFIDTKEVWKFGVYDGNSSLDLLAYSFGVESSKSDMSGDKVKDVFYKEKDIKKIADYCEKDVVALATIYLRMKGIKNNLTK
jgi:DNA polymerase elongation subunit (family B)